MISYYVDRVLCKWRNSLPASLIEKYPTNVDIFRNKLNRIIN